MTQAAIDRQIHDRHRQQTLEDASRRNHPLEDSGSNTAGKSQPKTGTQKEEAQLKRVVSNSPRMHETFRRVKRAAEVDSTVLITGESGTGKELVAEAIHSNSPRSEGPFVTINMAAVPEPLIESELLGHVKGSFTGAADNRIGRFEEAHGGTIFIDEIGDLHKNCQAKLLRILENRIVTPVGGNDERHVDVRVVAATNRDLLQMIADDEFRADLFYRLNVVQMDLPPLRERKGDIPLLVRHFLEELAERHQRPMIDVEPALLDYLNSLHWEGNVRQLRNCIESMFVLSGTNRLSLEDVPATIRAEERANRNGVKLPESLTLAELEDIAVAQSLERCNGNRTHAANQLGISVRTLQRKLARFPQNGN